MVFTSFFDRWRGNSDTNIQKKEVAAPGYNVSVSQLMKKKIKKPKKKDDEENELFYDAFEFLTTESDDNSNNSIANPSSSQLHYYQSGNIGNENLSPPTILDTSRTNDTYCIGSAMGIVAHYRNECKIHAYTTDETVDQNWRHCNKCYCKVCHKPVLQCNRWTVHCNKQHHMQQAQERSKKRKSMEAKPTKTHFMPANAEEENNTCISDGAPDPAKMNSDHVFHESQRNTNKADVAQGCSLKEEGDEEQYTGISSMRMTNNSSQKGWSSPQIKNLKKRKQSEKTPVNAVSHQAGIHSRRLDRNINARVKLPSTTVKPRVLQNNDLLHFRFCCPINVFDCTPNHPSPFNQIFCKNCFCYVCDTTANKCYAWTISHCHATNTGRYAETWKERRKQHKVEALLIQKKQISKDQNKKTARSNIHPSHYDKESENDEVITVPAKRNRKSMY